MQSVKTVPMTARCHFLKDQCVQIVERGELHELNTLEKINEDRKTRFRYSRLNFQGPIISLYNLRRLYRFAMK